MWGGDKVPVIIKGGGGCGKTLGTAVLVGMTIHRLGTYRVLRPLGDLVHGTKSKSLVYGTRSKSLVYGMIVWLRVARSLPCVSSPCVVGGSHAIR